MTDSKTCPDCAESVRAEARKCRYCGYSWPTPTASEQASDDPKEYKAGLLGPKVVDADRRPLMVRWQTYAVAVPAIAILLLADWMLSFGPLTWQAVARCEGQEDPHAMSDSYDDEMDWDDCMRRKRAGGLSFSGY